ncbi:2-aminomuconic semialdehyde dehydrogenase isoform X2 [Nerophis ophidion]|uniref:2-aminomuconic semialdehyde dehydrogenase isoform X2 n=1 Tax=Nerophis ophidion TaxID=159077 RepID=UPI002AE074CB|nr:2-aminomuconic semialdehyde dehydrogenase isoform X2 [Nerophis ophidion]
MEKNTFLILENFIGGKFVPCPAHIDSYDPSTGEVYCKVPDSGEEEVDAAVQAAKEAFPGWSARSPDQRAQVLNKLADLIEGHLEEFAQAESRDQGKTVTFARTVDIPRSAYNFRFFASSVLHHTTDCHQMDHVGCLNYTVRCPVGVAGLISPWNLPLYLLTWKIAPAIAAGNTVVAKPSEMSSVTAWMMCKLMQEAGRSTCDTFRRGTHKMMQHAGVPSGVVNIVFGLGSRAGDALVGHPEVPLISFTGSTATARHITERSAPYCKKLSLELGGKNPALVFADADLDRCIETTGEICLCTSRIYVERSIYATFLEKFVAAARKWKTGVPSDPCNKNGALISKEHLEKVRSFVALAKSEGATVHCGEGINHPDLPKRNINGYFMAATVISGVADSSRVMQDEIFGPVTCVSPFDGEDEAVAKANGVRYGLAATVWSRDVGKVHRVARRLQTGLVWTNCWLVRDLNLPFGGMKNSGVGREGGRDSYHFFTEVKTVTIQH